MKKKKIIVIGSLISSFIIIILIAILLATIIPKKQKEKELEEQIKQYYAEKIQLYEQENDLYDDYEVDIAFLGDSLTDGYNVKEYFSEYLVSNRGIGGETTVGLEKRMKVSVYNLKPKVIVMLIGANNMDEMFNNYERLLIGMKENLPNTKVVLLSLTAMGKTISHKNELAAYNNVKIEKYAEKYNYYYVDLFTPLYDVETCEVYEGYTYDGGHFTKKGYDVVTSIIKPVITAALNDYNNNL